MFSPSLHDDHDDDDVKIKAIMQFKKGFFCNETARRYHSQRIVIVDLPMINDFIG